MECLIIDMITIVGSRCKRYKKAAEQLEKIGINLIAVALERSCYENLSRIYNNVVLCDNLNKLPEQMTRILKKFIIK